MYFMLDARNDNGEIKEGGYIELVSDFESARQYAEANGPSNSLYDCYMLKTDIMDKGYWLLKKNSGGWDFYYDFGSPLIISTNGLNQSWSEFESSADEDTLAKAKTKASNGSYQAIYDTYQVLSGNISESELGYTSYGSPTEKYTDFDIFDLDHNPKFDDYSYLL